MKDDLRRVNLLEVSPVRVAAWEEVAGRVVVVRPRPRRLGVRGARDWLLYLLGARRIRLDEVGSAIWRALDGEHTVGEVAARLRHEFGAAVEPAEERLGRLVRVLRREGLIRYRGWDQ